ncbi:hypothetical protein [Veronia pacifica]|uniref:DUF4328 domain-containing protein n=1 Tax=Veronia pacifica TaxID=1080227 RepID=A0A1C3ESL2_9GAMM|nr:hypothetical protein [Veronia pacifica]ODA36214.1 hypothetical protein A8L45_01010 [Veronia pacifica]
MLLILIKILLSIPVAYGLVYPFVGDGLSGGIMDELSLFGTTGSIIIACSFLLLVYFYCRDLYRVMLSVSPNSRDVKASSVWLMFLIPYNFIEDFFIMKNVADALDKERVKRPSLTALKTNGLWLGYGWCAAQIVSLLPFAIGSIAGLVAIILWLLHWRVIRSALHLMRDDKMMAVN